MQLPTTTTTTPTDFYLPSEQSSEAPTKLPIIRAGRAIDMLLSQLTTITASIIYLSPFSVPRTVHNLLGSSKSPRARTSNWCPGLQSGETSLGEIAKCTASTFAPIVSREGASMAGLFNAASILVPAPQPPSWSPISSWSLRLRRQTRRSPIRGRRERRRAWP